MKLHAMKYILLGFMLFFTIATKAQVGVGTATPETSAKLDVSSTTKGFLPPRMDSTQRNAIVSPAQGLTIYNTTSKAFEVFNGTAWYSTVHYIGESYGGGIVFYVYDNGQHGLISSTSNQSSSIKWWAGAYTNTMAYADGVGAGKANTALIISSQGLGDGTTYAARICNEYSVTVGDVTYGDWYLPSKHELNLLFTQSSVVGGFVNSYYWSSTDLNGFNAWLQVWGNGYQGDYGKSYSFCVRAIRSF